MRGRPCCRFGVLLCLLLLSPAVRAGEQRGGTATFALVVGVNRSDNPRLLPLQYADDDAARFFDLFRVLGASTYLVARLDENTSRLHPQAMAEARVPRGESFRERVETLAADVGRARALGLETTFYFVYAGHGQLVDGQGAISLEDKWITGAQLLSRVVDRVGATRSHLIVDACYSYFLTRARGPGGTRRPARGFSHLDAFTARPDVGLLLSTSSARESHEWEAFQSGVFSHEIRSGLYGAADADADGQVSYREIAAFIVRANAAIPNERYRPDVYARPLPTSDVLLDLNGALGNALEANGAQAAHFVMEDARGVRLVDFHPSASSRVRLIRPPAAGTLYVRRISDDLEYRIPSSATSVQLDDLPVHPPRARSRGAATESFSLIFSLPFDAEWAREFVLHPSRPEPPSSSRSFLERNRSTLALLTLGVGGAAAGAGIGLNLSARALRRDIDGSDSQASVSRQNGRIQRRNSRSAAMYTVAGAGVVGGLLVLAWPRFESPVSAAFSRDSATIELSGEF